ncbi:helix-turn-helix domain-containing protein [Saccharopolyspora sp. MS10]|uniref:helix-turn-helix domain-containing protein n=1 Tax=Saccharopolyspora sp. MS10 TaxID=3385973 RepID=UPI0039A2D31B
MDKDPRGQPAPGAPLRQLLVAVGEPLIDLLAAPAGLDADVRDVVIVEPEEDAAGRPGDLVLVIGARGRSALRQVRSAGRAGASAVAVKIHDDQDARALRDAALDAGIALFGVGRDVRWEQLESLVRSVVDNARLTDDADAGEAVGDLFSLAQTVAAMTGGAVSIEDVASRVLAYSRSDDDVDELRRLSILGRRGPEPYLVMLREWGVYERLRSGEDVVRVEERPDLGIRRRMAVGIHAGSQPLGTIWVQEGATPLQERSPRALLGAARVAAVQLVRQRAEASAAPRLRENLLLGLLDGKVDAEGVAGTIGAAANRPAVVLVFTVRGVAGVADRPELELERSEMTGLISVHAAAYRRSALVTTAGTRVYVLLPDLPSHALPGVLGMTREIVAAAGRQLRAAVQAGVGSVVPGLDAVPQSRAEADRVLDAMGRDLDAQIATIADVRSRVLVSELLTVLGGAERYRDPRLEALFAHDAEHAGSLARSVLAYLERFGDVRSASAALHVHPNTLRHRLRRAAEIAGIDLSDPDERLAVHLHLLLRRRHERNR